MTVLTCGPVANAVASAATIEDISDPMAASTIDAAEDGLRAASEAGGAAAGAAATEAAAAEAGGADAGGADAADAGGADADAADAGGADAGGADAGGADAGAEELATVSELIYDGIAALLIAALLEA